jgi:hypothetical protein
MKSLIFAALLVTSQSSVKTGAEVVPLLQSKLRASDSISLYIVSRTGKYVYSNDQLKSKAGITIHRKCAAACVSRMKAVLEHLSVAKRAACQEGQEDTLIESGDRPLMIYSYSGRFIKVGQVCYFNSTSVRGLIQTKEFLFD